MNLFGAIFFNMNQNNIFSACSTPALRGFAMGNPLGEKRKTLLF